MSVIEESIYLIAIVRFRVQIQARAEIWFDISVPPATP